MVKEGKKGRPVCPNWVMKKLGGVKEATRERKNERSGEKKSSRQVKSSEGPSLQEKGRKKAMGGERNHSIQLKERRFLILSCKTCG